MPTRQTQQPTMTSIRVPKALVRQLQAVADAHARSITAEARVALTEYVDKHKSTKR